MNKLALIGALSLALGACAGGSNETNPSPAPVAVPIANTNPGQPKSCGAADHSRVGEVTNLSTRSHNVSGQARIVDNCTIEISNFSYDGGGLSKVFIYGAKGANYASGFAIGNNLKGTVFNKQTLRVNLQAGDLDKLDGISVWCADANANFGDGLFAPART